MRIRKLVAVLAAASLAFWAPSIIPAKATVCGVVEYHAIDTAYAGAFPCPVPHAPSPWPAVAVLVGTVSVMLNAAIVWKTQCRELTSAEAMTSAFLPFFGIALNAQASKCHL
ncbi:MAG: hypothetical protein ABR863_10140 [Roseiarcus sp.]|jgi:hypothetical protein